MKSKMDSNPLFATKTVAMHNFIDKVEWKETEKKDYVLYFGRFSEEKGIGTLIKVCKELPDVQFIFAGTGPLEETVNGIKNIKNVGFQKGEALEKLIREARFSIYPSEWYENCPFSVMAYYYCFGCGANGDAIDLTAKLFDLNPALTRKRAFRG